MRRYIMDGVDSNIKTTSCLPWPADLAAVPLSSLG